MKPTRKILLLLLFFSSFVTFSQIDTEKQFQLTPYIGVSSPIGDFKNFSETGGVFGLSADKYLSSAFALGFDFNYQINPFASPYNYSSIFPSYTVNTETQGNWGAYYITFGPTYKLSLKKFSAEFYAKAGISHLKSPYANSNTELFSNTIDLFLLKKQNQTAFGATTGIRLNYQLSKNLALFINPQYNYSSTKMNYSYYDPEDGFNDGVFYEGLLLEQPLREGVIDRSHFNVNAGVTFNLGGNKKSKDTSGD